MTTTTREITTQEIHSHIMHYRDYMHANLKIPGIFLPVSIHSASVYACFDAMKYENYQKMPLHIVEPVMLVFIHVHLAAFAQQKMTTKQTKIFMS